jgi:hypothetical protein
MRSLWLLVSFHTFTLSAQIYRTVSQDSDGGLSIVVSPVSTDTTKKFERIFGGLVDGVSISLFPDGRIRSSEFALPDQLKIRRVWDENGRLRREQLDRLDGKQGYITIWYESGQLQFTAQLKNEKIHGTAMEWTEEGKLIRDETYQDSELIRTRIKGSPLGQVAD